MSPDLGALIRAIGSYGGAALTVLLAVYLIPGSPLRKIVEEWIRGRVSSQFDKELETHRHRLALDAEQVRADHQRRLHDAGLYSVKKHEVYRELFNKLLIADGYVGRLSGGRLVPSFEDFSAEDMRGVMERAEFTTPQKEAVLRDWDKDRKNAMKAFNTAMRNVELSNADRSIAEASNYFLVNALYVNDAHSNAVAEIINVLRKNLAHALFPDEHGSGSEQLRLKKEASELIERLKRALREDLDAGSR